MSSSNGIPTNGVGPRQGSSDAQLREQFNIARENAAPLAKGGPQTTGRFPTPQSPQARSQPPLPSQTPLPQQTKSPAKDPSRGQPSGAPPGSRTGPGVGAASTTPRDAVNPRSIETIGRRLSQQRKDAGITQIKVASNMGSTQPSVARFERDANQPNLRTVERYASSINSQVVADLGVPGGEQTQVGLDKLVDQLSDMRKDKGLSQTEVAKSMGATQPMVARFESGEPAPNLKTVERYASALGFQLGLSVVPNS